MSDHQPLTGEQDQNDSVNHNLNYSSASSKPGYGQVVQHQPKSNQPPPQAETGRFSLSNYVIYSTH